MWQHVQPVLSYTTSISYLLGYHRACCVEHMSCLVCTGMACGLPVGMAPCATWRQNLRVQFFLVTEQGPGPSPGSGSIQTRRMWPLHFVCVSHMRPPWTL